MGRFIVAGIIVLVLYKGFAMLKATGDENAERLAERRKAALEGPQIPTPSPAAVEYDKWRREQEALRIEPFELRQAGLARTPGVDDSTLARAVKEITRFQRVRESAMLGAGNRPQAWRDSVMRDVDEQIRRIRNEVMERRP